MDSSRPSSAAVRLFTTRRAATWVVLVLLAFGLLLYGTDLLLTLQRPIVAAVAWTGGLVQAGALLLIGWLLLRRRGIRPSVVVTSIGLGAMFAPGLASLLNPGGSAALAPVVEECTKLLAAAAVLWLARPLLRGPLDGFAVGYFVGLGFEVAEDIVYAFDAAQSSGDAAAATELVVDRTLIGFGLHNLFSAFAAAGLAYAVVRGGRAWGALPLGLAIAIVLHALWDNVPMPVPPFGQLLLLYLPFLVLFALLRVWCGRVERRFARPAPPA